MPKKANLRLFTSVVHYKSIRKKPKMLKRAKVYKMLAIMEAQQNAGPSNGTNTSSLPPEHAAGHSKEFLATGRTGRRNALPDILGEQALVTSSDLPTRLQSLTTSDPVPGTSHDTNEESSKPNS